MTKGKSSRSLGGENQVKNVTRSDINSGTINNDSRRCPTLDSSYKSEYPIRSTKPTKCRRVFATEGRPFDLDIDRAANQYHNSNNPYSNTIPTAALGRPFSLEQEMARNQQIALSCLRAKQETDACPRSQIRSHRSSKFSNSPTSAHGKPFDLEEEIHRHQVNTLHDYNTQRDSTFHRFNIPTPRERRSTSCPTPMQTRDAPGAINHQSPVRARSSSVCRSPIRSQSIRCYTTPKASNLDRSQLSSMSTNQRTMQPAPGTVTKTVTTTTTTRTIPPRTSHQSAFSSPKYSDISQRQQHMIMTPPLTPDQTRSPKSPTTSLYYSADRSRRQNATDNSLIGRDTTKHMAEAYEQTPLRRITSLTPPGTPETSFDIAPLPYDPQSPIGNFTYDSPQSESTRLYDNVTLPTPTRYGYTPDDTSFAQVTSFTPPPPPPPSTLESIDVPQSNAGDYSSIQESRHFPLEFLADDTSYEDFSHPGTYNVSSDNDMDRSLDQNTSKSSPTTKQQRSLQASRRSSRQVEYPHESFEDPIEETRYQQKSMDSSGRQLPTGPDCSLERDTGYSSSMMASSGRRSSKKKTCPTEKSYSMHSCPQDILPSNDGHKYQPYSSERFLNSTMIPSSSGKACRFEDLVVPQFESTDYQNLPSSQHVLESDPPVCPTRGSLFRCLAKKLSTTYDALSSFMTDPKTGTGDQPQTTGAAYERKMNQNFDTKAPYYRNTMNYGLDSEFSRQCADEDTNTFAVNTTFGNNFPTTNIPESVRACANAKRCGRLKLNTSDKSNDHSSTRKVQIDMLVDDTYCPGLIQDTIDGREKFNCHSFDIMRDSISYEEGPPKEDPMTLLEAFSLRIENERTKINSKLEKNSEKEQTEDIIYEYFSTANPTELNESIKCLLLSEHILEDEPIEPCKEKSFEADVQKFATSFPDNPKMKLVIYTGCTKPSEDLTPV